MIVEYTQYKIDEKRRTAFVENYRKPAGSLKASKNCLAHQLQCTEDRKREECSVRRKPTDFPGGLAGGSALVAARELPLRIQRAFRPAVSTAGMNYASPWVSYRF